MRSAPHGGGTLAAEVTNISQHGFRLLVRGTGMFVAFDRFPWFREASVGRLLSVEMPHPGHLHWTELDVDLAVDAIEHPERFPLVSRARPVRRDRRAGRARAPRATASGRRPKRG